MFLKDDFNNVLIKLKEKGYLNEFISKTFNYKIDDSARIDFYVQEINDDIVLYVYSRQDKNIVNAYEFINDDNEVYMEKTIYKSITINTIHIKKCEELYNDNIITDNVILFIKAISSDNMKEILLEYLDKNIVDIIVNN